MIANADPGKINTIKLRHKGLDFNLMKIPVNSDIYSESREIEPHTLEICFADMIEVTDLIETLERFRSEALSNRGTWNIIPRKR